MKATIGVDTFAKRLGVAPADVRRAIREGRIKLDKNGDIDWHTQKDVFGKRGTGGSVTTAKKILPATDADGGTFMAARIRKENAAAQLKEIELSRARNKYLEKEAVRNAMFKWARTVRDNLLAIPERIAADLAAQLIAIMKDKKPSEAEVERLVRSVWVKETRDALLALDKRPDIKNAAKKTGDEEESEE